MFGKKKKRQVLKIEKGQWAQIWESFKQNKLAKTRIISDFAQKRTENRWK